MIYVPSPHCRHRRTRAGKHWRECADCGAVTFDDYWADGWDETPEHSRSVPDYIDYGVRPGIDFPATM